MILNSLSKQINNIKKLTKHFFTDTLIPIVKYWTQNDITLNINYAINYKNLNKLIIKILWVFFISTIILTLLNSYFKLPQFYTNFLGLKVIPPVQAFWTLIISVMAMILPIYYQNKISNLYHYRLVLFLSFSILVFSAIFLSGGSPVLFGTLLFMLAFSVLYADFRLACIIFLGSFSSIQAVIRWQPDLLYFQNITNTQIWIFNTLLVSITIFTSLTSEAYRTNLKILNKTKQRLESELVEKKKNELQIIKFKDHLNIILRGIQEGITVQDCSLQIVFANQVAANMLGYASVESMLQSKSPLVFNVFNQAQNESQEKVIHFTPIGSKEKRWSILKSTPIQDKNGKMLYLVNIFHDITEQKKNQEKIYNLAYFDQLTKLPNRSFFFEKLQKILSTSHRHRYKTALLYIDLDKFKQVNDSMGHMVGDTLLQMTAMRLKKSVRQEDLVARIGGDEFTLTLVNFNEREDIENVASKIIGILSKPFRINDLNISITPSIGIAILPDTSQDLNSILLHADSAMYLAKNKGGSRFEFYSENKSIRSKESVRIENLLRSAISRNEFSIQYQPIIDLKTKKVLSLEALLRWDNPEIGRIEPEKFIPIAEETGQIASIDEWVINTVCRQTKYLQSGLFNHVKISVNVSQKQFNPHFSQMIKNVLKETHYDPNFLELEIGGVVNSQNFNLTQNTLLKMKEAGISTTLDNFGTNNSSLNEIKDMAFSSLKIDRQVVRNFTKNPTDIQMIRSIINVAHNFKLKAIAQGVENIEQMDKLSSLHCDSIQGFLISEPKPLEKFNQFYIQA